MASCKCSCSSKETHGDTQSKALLLGSANAGKSTLFNLLTGGNQTIGNWPGVTVDKKTGIASLAGNTIEVVDLPGVMSLSSPESTRLDERVTRSVLLEEKADQLIVVLDPTILERSVALLVQAMEYNLPILAVFTKADLWAKGELAKRAELVSNQLGIPVFAISTVTKEGVDTFLRAVGQEIATKPERPAKPEALAAAIADLSRNIKESKKMCCSRARVLATRILEGDKLASEMVPESAVAFAKTLSEKVEADTGLPTALVLSDETYSRAIALCQAMELPEPKSARAISDKIDRFALSRYWGIPIFLAALYAMFFVSINFSSSFIELFDGIGAAVFVETPVLILHAVGLDFEFLTLLVSSFGGGIQTVLTFVPVVGFLFLCQAILEQSGYMARAAVVTDRLMRKLGLSGRAFLPMILGFGCTVPAIASTRSLATERERIVTSMMTPFMSCGARLPVYALFAAAFFPDNGQNVVFMLYLLGIAAAIFTGLVLSKSYYAGASTPLAIELPTYQLPPVGQVLRITGSRLKGFIVGAGKVIVVVVGVLAVLNAVDFKGNTGNEGNGNSVLAVVSKSVAPVFEPLGIEEDNWPATVGLVSGIFAKEALVGTLQALYSPSIDEAELPNPLETLSGSVEAFTDTLVGLGAAALDPLGLDVGYVSNAEESASELEVEVSLFSTMREHFDGKVGALAYMILVLLYIPCAAAVGALWREVGRNWAMFAVGWTTLLSYSSAVIFYQVGTFARHPATSAAWVVVLVAAIAAVVIVMRKRANHDDQAPLAASLQAN
ncbi:ferrous iron transport protein B [Rhodobacteraceae bacterium RKSG542]|uniref:ferrous iron transport protein B n=1 Tax=Pseudovibrio flavus TaxID=2529854 RepID=UPI0012BBD213|nr:ferrous iron transport protein B [Pseudovibrio flavus]MTI15841.1 ferrous iron transport protein B [Pseudovibrio flavus]